MLLFELCLYYYLLILTLAFVTLQRDEPTPSSNFEQKKNDELARLHSLQVSRRFPVADNECCAQIHGRILSLKPNQRVVSNMTAECR